MSSIFVMVNFGCQFHCIWNQLNPKLLGTPVRDFFHQTVWSRKSHLKSGWHILEAAQIQRYKTRKLGLCLLALTLAGKSIYPVNVTSSGFQTDWRQQLSWNPPGLWHQERLLRHHNSPFNMCIHPVCSLHLENLIVHWLKEHHIPIIFF